MQTHACAHRPWRAADLGGRWEAESWRTWCVLESLRATLTSIHWLFPFQSTQISTSICQDHSTGLPRLQFNYGSHWPPPWEQTEAKISVCVWGLGSCLGFVQVYGEKGIYANHEVTRMAGERLAKTKNCSVVSCQRAHCINPDAGACSNHTYAEALYFCIKQQILCYDWPPNNEVIQLYISLNHHKCLLCIKTKCFQG